MIKAGIFKQSMVRCPGRAISLCCEGMTVLTVDIGIEINTMSGGVHTSITCIPLGTTTYSEAS